MIQVYKSFKFDTDGIINLRIVKFKNTGTYKADGVVNSEYWDVIKQQRALGARQFIFMDSLIIRVLEKLLANKDTVLLHCGINEDRNHVDEIVNNYIRDEYHREKPSYKFLFDIYELSKNNVSWSSCQYLQRYRGRYYQVVLRSNGIIEFKSLTDFDQMDHRNMDEMAEEVIGYVKIAWNARG